MFFFIFFSFGILQLINSQYFPSNQNGRCPPVLECPPIPTACLNYIAQRQQGMQPRIPMVPQNSMYFLRQTLANSVQPPNQLDQGLQPVRLPPISSSYGQPLPTYTPLHHGGSFADNSFLNTYSPNSVLPRPIPAGLNTPPNPQINNPSFLQPSSFGYGGINDCCGRCSMICQHSNRHIRAYNQKSHNIKATDENCTHLELRNIMAEVITSKADESKRLIQRRAEEAMGGDFHVICSNDDFTYITKSSVYCQINKNNTVCYAFQTQKPTSDNVDSVETNLTN